MLQNIKNFNFPVDGFIFITNDFITANEFYDHPKIISLITDSTGDKLRPYSFNYG